MPDQETVFYMARIVQELCHVMPRKAVTYFAEGLRRRHRAIPEDLQRQLDALANILLQMDSPAPPRPCSRPKLRLIKGGTE
jgi:hypothetical protein